MEISGDIQQGMRAREAGWNWLGLVEPTKSRDFDSVVAQVGLGPLEGSWHELGRSEAEAFLTALLHVGLAYSNELVPLPTARDLARGFLDSVGGPESRFACNRSRFEGQGSVLGHSSSWDPLTSHTFDTGIVAIGENGGAVYWVAEED